MTGVDLVRGRRDRGQDQKRSEEERRSSARWRRMMWPRRRARYDVASDEEDVEGVAEADGRALEGSDSSGGGHEASGSSDGIGEAVDVESDVGVADWVASDCVADGKDLAGADVAVNLGSGRPVVEGAGSVMATPPDARLGSMLGPGKDV